MYTYSYAKGHAKPTQAQARHQALRTRRILSSSCTTGVLNASTCYQITKAAAPTRDRSRNRMAQHACLRRGCFDGNLHARKRTPAPELHSSILIIFARNSSDSSQLSRINTPNSLQMRSKLSLEPRRRGGGGGSLILPLDAGDGADNPLTPRNPQECRQSGRRDLVRRSAPSSLYSPSFQKRRKRTIMKGSSMGMMTISKTKELKHSSGLRYVHGPEKKWRVTHSMRNSCRRLVPSPK